MNKSTALSKWIFKHTKLAAIIFMFLLAIQVGMDVVNANIVSSRPAGTQASMGIWINNQLFQYSAGWIVLVYIILFAILQPARNFKKYMNMNVKKPAFIRGCAVSYLIAAAAGAIFNLLCRQLLDRWLMNNGYAHVWNMLDVFGWSGNGLVLGVIQCFAFFLVLSAFFYMLAACQGSWYGWAMDAAILIVLCVFLPIAPLRAGVYGFFRLILFHPTAFVQILACLVFSAVFYLAGSASIIRKKI